MSPRRPRRCLVVTGDPQATADALLADGQIEQGDADALVEFAAFLREAGPRTDAAGVRRKVPPEVLLKYRGLLGLSDDEVAALERRLGGAAGG